MRCARPGLNDEPHNPHAAQSLRQFKQFLIVEACLVDGKAVGADRDLNGAIGTCGRGFGAVAKRRVLLAVEPIQRPRLVEGDKKARRCFDGRSARLYGPTHDAPHLRWNDGKTCSPYRGVIDTRVNSVKGNRDLGDFPRPRLQAGCEQADRSYSSSSSSSPPQSSATTVVRAIRSPSRW